METDESTEVTEGVRMLDEDVTEPNANLAPLAGATASDGSIEHAAADDGPVILGSQAQSTKRKLGETTTGSTPCKRQKVIGPTRLRKGRQVAATVPMDVWEMILSYCPAKFLAKARRINKAFHHALQYESAWRRNRLQNHGPDMPDPPSSMKEDEYANLIEGLGCMGCGAKKTRKTYWVWKKRWCQDCLQKNTIKDNEAMRLVGQDQSRLLNCVPYGIVDSWGHYEAAGHYAKAVFRGGHGHYKIYGNDDIAELLSEREQMMKPDASGKTKSAAEVDQWYAAKQAARDETMSQSQKIESWINTRNKSRLSKNAGLKAERAKDFQERAQALDPPLDVEALHHIAAYKRSIDIARPPSDRAWNTLLPKLEQGRAAAEALVEERRRRILKAERERNEQATYLRKLKRRTTGGCVEQRIVGALADQVLMEFEESTEPIEDADFVLLALRAIRRKYYEATTQYAADHPQDIPYRLRLEDARWALEKKIYPHMEAWGCQRSIPARLFKCPGCTRPDTCLSYSFEALFCHIRRKHATQAGQFEYFYREGLEGITAVHWLDIEWPTNLPVLAQHHHSTGTWHPDDESPYVRYQAASHHPITSAFEGRRVSEEGPNHANVVKNMVYAGSMLRDTPLEGTYKTSIAMKYAVEKCRAVTGDPYLSPPIDAIVDLPLDLIRAGLYDICDGFRCAVCLWSEGIPATGLIILHSPSSLIHHFKRCHASTRQWDRDMMLLPSDRELFRVLSLPGMEKALGVFDRLFPKCEGDAPGDGGGLQSAITPEPSPGEVIETHQCLVSGHGDSPSSPALMSGNELFAPREDAHVFPISPGLSLNSPGSTLASMGPGRPTDDPLELAMDVDQGPGSAEEMRDLLNELASISS